MIPVVALVIGAAYLGAGWRGGDLQFGVFDLVLMVAVAAGAVLLRRYSEAVSGLMDGGDERINSIDRQATAVAGIALTAAVIVGFIVDIARGGNGWPYSMIGAIGGVSYIAALIFYRLRR